MTPQLALAIVAMSIFGSLGWVLTSWIRARQDNAGAAMARDGLEASRQIELLSNENAGLKGQVSRLEERIAVLERIATDPAERTAREIDNLR